MLNQMKPDIAINAIPNSDKRDPVSKMIATMINMQMLNTIGMILNPLFSRSRLTPHEIAG
jgi:hypothetical protein